MRLSPTSLALVAFASAALFVGCGDSPKSSDDDEAGNGGSGATSSGGNVNTGGVGAGSGAPAGGASSGSGGNVNTGGVGAGSGAPAGGASSGSGNVGGTPSTGGASGANTGGASGANTGGASGASTGGAGGAPMDVDQNGKRNATPGSMTSTPQDYLRLGEIRLLNNNWGSEDLNCTTSTMSVFVNQDRSFGWTFNRPNCDTGNTNQHPDFPQVEFGIHPFGVGNALATSPDFSSTTLLPLQIRNITSSSVTLQNLSIQLQRGGSWNITFEFWLSTQDPRTQGSAGVHTELMTFWGWQPMRWPSAPGADGAADGGSIGAAGGDQVTAGGKSYRLWVQRDMWADGWRYYQFRDSAGSQMNFSGTVDVKALLNYLVNTRGFSQDLWVTRLEVGSEIDDETQGTVTMQNITFMVNGQSRSPVFGP
jgi:hypothetical protein